MTFYKIGKQPSDIVMTHCDIKFTRFIEEFPISNPKWISKNGINPVEKTRTFSAQQPSMRIMEKYSSKQICDNHKRKRNNNFLNSPVREGGIKLQKMSATICMQVEFLIRFKLWLSNKISLQFGLTLIWSSFRFEIECFCVYPLVVLY